MHTYRASAGPPTRRGWRLAGVVSALTLASTFVAPAASAAEGDPAPQADGNAAEAPGHADDTTNARAGSRGGSLGALSHRDLPDQANDRAGGNDNANENANAGGNPNENAGGNPNENAGGNPNEDAGDGAPATTGQNASDGTLPEHAADPAQDNANVGGGQGGDGEDPAGGQGNRGFVQVSSDHDFFPPNNDPHVGCEFWLAFYNFREGTERARVTFTLQPPTGGPGVELTDYPRTVALNGEDTNGVTLNGFQRYDLATALAGLERHGQQGYHVKVTIETTPEDVSADLKHHVFWVDCDAAPAEREEEEETADLRVQKRVVGAEPPGDDTTFTVAVTCDGTTVDAVLVAGETWRWNEDADAATEADVDDVGPGSECSITETEDRGADPVTVTFDGADVDQGEVVTLVANASNRFLITNAFGELVTAPGGDDEEVEGPGGQPGGDSAEGGGDRDLGVGGERVDAAPGAEGDDVAAPADEEEAGGAPVTDRRGGDGQPAVAAGVDELPRTGIPSSVLLVLAIAMIALGTAALRRSAGAEVAEVVVESRPAAVGSRTAAVELPGPRSDWTSASPGHVSPGGERIRRIQRWLAALAVGCALLAAGAQGTRDEAALVPV
jgi:hypothetical protein